MNGNKIPQKITATPRRYRVGLGDSTGMAAIHSWLQYTLENSNEYWNYALIKTRGPNAWIWSGRYAVKKQHRWSSCREAMGMSALRYGKMQTRANFPALRSCSLVKDRWWSMVWLTCLSHRRGWQLFLGWGAKQSRSTREVPQRTCLLRTSVLMFSAIHLCCHNNVSSRVTCMILFPTQSQRSF